MIKGIVLILLLLGGCAQTPQQVSSKDKKDEFYWIDDDDFKPTDEIVYREVEDFYNVKTKLPNALASETLVTVTSRDLQIVTRNSDPLSKSVALCYQGKFDQAFKIIDQNYAKYKQHPGYWNQIGSCYLLQNKPRKAILYYHRARIRGKNSYAPAMNNLGVIYVRKNEYQKALAAFERAASVNPQAKTPRMNMAQLYLRFGLVDKAERLLVQMKRQTVDDPEINSLLGTIQVYKKNYGQALLYFNYLPATFYQRADLTLNYVLALYFEGKKEQAKKIFGQINQQHLGALTDYYYAIQKRIL